MTSALVFRDVACLRGQRLLFEGLSFSLAPGDAALVSGPNGAGKSSLIRIAAGLLAPATGSVAGEGARALMGDTAALDPELSLGAALRFWAKLDGRDAVAVESALSAVALEALVEVPVRLLSTGQRRRAALARVIASGTPVWLLDEPANGLDTGAVALLEQAMAAHRRTGGVILAATHLPLALPGAIEVAL